VRTQWSLREREVTAAYEKILRDLQKEQVDGDEFIRLRRRIEELQPLRDREQLVQRSLDELEQRRRNLLAEWDDLRTSEFQALQRAAKRVSKALALLRRPQPTGGIAQEKDQWPTRGNGG